jgi:hypothetical protein
MNNPQGPGKQGRKDAKAKAQQQHHAGAPGRSDHPGQSARTQSDQSHQGHMPHRPSHSSSQSHSHSSQMEDDE